MSVTRIPEESGVGTSYQRFSGVYSRANIIPDSIVGNIQRTGAQNSDSRVSVLIDVITLINGQRIATGEGYAGIAIIVDVVPADSEGVCGRRRFLLFIGYAGPGI